MRASFEFSAILSSKIDHAISIQPVRAWEYLTIAKVRVWIILGEPRNNMFPHGMSANPYKCRKPYR
eukprot:1320090-Amphidinium_carterae.1